MTFERIWSQVKGIPDTAKKQVPGVLSESTKNKLAKKTPDEVAAVVKAAIDEVNHGSIEPLDTLIKSRI